MASTPHRGGNLHLAILVLTRGKPIPESAVTIRAVGQDGKDSVQPTTGIVLDDLAYHELDVLLPSAGLWTFTIDITGPKALRPSPCLCKSRTPRPAQQTS